MYQNIHDDLIARFRAKKDFRLVERRLNIGKALKQLKNRGRMRMLDLINKSGVSRTCINALIQVGEMNTSRERFMKLIEALDIPVDEFVRIARETAHYNFYHIKANEPPLLKSKTHEIEIYSPPSFSKRDFVWCLVRIYPGKAIEHLIHQTMDQVAGFVIHGHLNLKYGEKNFAIHTNQSFFFDPKINHSFENQAGSGTTEFYLLYQLKSESIQKPETRGRKPSPAPISTATLIQQIRRELSPDPNRLLGLPTLAALSGIDVDSLAHLSYRKTKIIPFEKIDRLANLTDHSFEHIIQKAENHYEGYVTVFTDEDKAIIDLTMRHGVYFNNHAGTGIGKRRFSITDVTFEPWNEGRLRKEWRYRGVGYIGLAVQRGIIGIQYGSQPMKTLGWGESLYFNADVDTTIVNFLSEEEAKKRGESKEAKAIVFSAPPIF